MTKREHKMLNHLLDIAQFANSMPPESLGRIAQAGVRESFPSKMADTDEAVTVHVLPDGTLAI